MSQQIGSRIQAAYYSRRFHFKASTLKRRSNLQPLPLFTAIHVWGWMKCWFLSGRVLTPPSAPPWPFPHLLTPAPFMFDSRHPPQSHRIERDISGSNFDISPNGIIRAGWQFLLLPMTLPCVLLFQITSSVRHGCGRPTAAPRGGWWLDNLVTGMGWNWQNRWLAPILWTRDWPFPAHDQNLKRQKHGSKKARRGRET